MLLSIQGGSDLGLFEINEAAQLVSNSAAVDANLIFGAVINDALGDEVRVTVIAAGLDEQRTSPRPAPAPTKWVAAAHEYVPTPVLFESDDQEPGYSRDHGPSDTTAGREDSGLAGKQDDDPSNLAAGRRRPVAFQEDDDLDVPDFLK